MSESDDAMYFAKYHIDLALSFLRDLAGSKEHSNARWRIGQMIAHWRNDLNTLDCIERGDYDSWTMNHFMTKSDESDLEDSTKEQ